MISTEWRDDYRRIVRNRAVAYDDSGGGIRQDMPFENVHGNGGLLTTVSDLLRGNRNFTEQKLGGRALLEAQQDRGKLADGTRIAYAAGLNMLTHEGLPEVSHSGSTAGYRAWLARYPEQGLSVAVLCNAASANATQLGRAVADVFLGSAVRPAQTPQVSPDSATLAARAGMYRSTRNHEVMRIAESGGQLRAGNQILRPVAPNVFERGPGREVTLRVAVAGDRLVIRRRPDSVLPLTPTYLDGFASSLGSVRFLRDASGKVTEMSIGESRVWDLRLKRVR